MKLRLLLLTLALAVGLAVSMWLLGTVEFSYRTFAFHIVSVYVGVAGVLAYQQRSSR